MRVRWQLIAEVEKSDGSFSGEEERRITPCQKMFINVVYLMMYLKPKDNKTILIRDVLTLETSLNDEGP